MQTNITSTFQEPTQNSAIYDIMGKLYVHWDYINIYGIQPNLTEHHAKDSSVYKNDNLIINLMHFHLINEIDNL